jgi:hypothetical protein
MLNHMRGERGKVTDLQRVGTANGGRGQFLHARYRAGTPSTKSSKRRLGVVRKRRLFCCCFRLVAGARISRGRCWVKSQESVLFRLSA